MYLMNQRFKNIQLNVGDLIVDITTNHCGFLLSYERHIDMFKDDMWLWEIHWFTYNSKGATHYPINSITVMEEDSLKFSILVGRTEWYSIKGDTWNAETAQLERI